ncbi:MAG: hypothetical protein EAX89_17540 [Candidatus Lokiarchaeota archaeon]|nr:hypothetical protein [Candidatus Lokiarchaeota archaeon]
MEHKKWVFFCTLGGVLMIFAALIGSVGILGRVLSLLVSVMGNEIAQIINLTLSILGYVATGGGVSVILGAVIAEYSLKKLGRLIIGLGIGTSLIGLIIIIIMSLYSGISVNELRSVLISTFNGIYGFIGVIISIIGRKGLKK